MLNIKANEDRKPINKKSSCKQQQGIKHTVEKRLGKAEGMKEIRIREELRVKIKED